MVSGEHNKISILHVTFHMEIGGAEQVIKQLVVGLDSKHYLNSVVCLDNTIGSMGRELQAKGVTIHQLHRKPGLDWSLVFNLRKLISENNIDILHCHQYTPYAYGVFSTLLTPTKIIYTEHGRFYPDRFSWKRRMINQALALNTDAIVAISISTKNALVKYEWLLSKSITVIYNGIESSVDSDSGEDIKIESGFDQSNIILGTISRLDPIKNQCMMISALKIVLETKPNVRLMLVGDGPHRKLLEEHTRSLNLTEFVYFAGFQTDTRPYMHLLDIFLLSSYSEGTSMALLEAIAEGKPCIATNVGGNNEVLDDGVSGILVTNDDHHELAGSILRLINDPDFRREISNGAAMRFSSTFRLDLMISSYELQYNSIY